MRIAPKAMALALLALSASAEGSTRGFTACQPKYGDAEKRTFDFVDQWLAQPGRF